MAKENVKLFFEEVEKDAELQAKFNEITEKYNQSILNRLIEMGKEEGFEFTNEDLEAFNKEVILKILEEDELSEDALESIAGGFGVKIDGEVRLTVIDPMEEWKKKIKDNAKIFFPDII